MALTTEWVANSGVADRLLGWMVRRRRFPGIAVLCYHGIRSDDLPDRSMAFEGLHLRRERFAAHLAALSTTCQFISLDDWRRASHGATSLPPRPVHITFDDGYASVLRQALPVLERFAAPATVFVSTAAVEHHERYWYDAVACREGEGAAVALKEVEYDTWVSGVTSIDRTLDGPNDPHAPLTPREVQQLANHPLVEIGGHSDAHPMLAKAPLDAQRRDVRRCGELIALWTGKPMRAFAFPNGRPGIDFTDDTCAIVRAEGVDRLFSLEPRFASPDATQVSPRFLMTAGVSPAHLLHRLARVWQ